MVGTYSSSGGGAGGLGTSKLPVNRPEERIRWAREWLARHGIADAFEGIHSSSDGTAKVDIVRRLGAIALIEDDVRHLLKSPEVPLTRIHLAPHSGEGSQHPGIVTAADWAALVAALTGAL